MQIVGTFPEATPGLAILGRAALAILVLLLVPWLLIGTGCVLVGCAALSRGEASLYVCLPAGIAVLLGPPVLWHLQRRWYPPICRFEFDGLRLTYVFSGSYRAESRSITEVLRAYKGRKRGRRRPYGYYFTFSDGRSIFVSRWLTNADVLFRELEARIADRRSDSGGSADFAGKTPP